MIYKELFDLDKSISKSLFTKFNNEFEVLQKLKEEIENNIFIGNNVIIDKSATIIGPCIIDDNTVIRPNAYIRENVIIGKNSVLGNSCEIKNSILYDNVQVPHFNYVGDSILGYKSHMGASSIISNLKSVKTNVVIKYKDEKIKTNLKKVGAFLGDNVEVGCGSVLNPGTIIMPNTKIYPLISVRGVIESDSIVKDMNNIVKKI